MHTAGLLTLRSHLREGRLGDLVVELQRPAVTQLFLGKSADAVVATVPLLYSLCAQAQQTAALAALNAATGHTTAPAHSAALWLEVVHETLWRLLLDWPPAVGLPAAKDAFVAWRAARNGPGVVQATQALVQGLVQDVGAQCLARMPACEDSGSELTNPLQPVAWLQNCLHADAPVPAVQTPHAIRVAYQARMQQLQKATRALAAQTAFPVACAAAQGWGVAQVLTARGVLTHAAQVLEGRVVAYRVWAPTDVFFADNRALLALLVPQNFASVEQARTALGQAVLALDPCVPFELELRNA